jgi:hypothetical protein
MSIPEKKTAVLILSDPCGGDEALFGASESVQATGLDLIKDNPLPGTSGLASLRALVDDGYTILQF